MDDTFPEDAEEFIKNEAKWEEEVFSQRTMGIIG
jgi:hypothetical protein